MATIQDRAFSKDYSGLVTQAGIAGVLFLVCSSSFEYMKRKRRGEGSKERLGSVETWQFGYLYQGRSWARDPSPPHRLGWPLRWIEQAITFPEEKMNKLVGVDATLYCRFLRGCSWFLLLHTATTMAILLPIHVRFSPPEIPKKSMTRASISSLVLDDSRKPLLWIHMCLAYWVAVTWISTLLWICGGAFRLRAASIECDAARLLPQGEEQLPPGLEVHPHPHWPFHIQNTHDGSHGTGANRRELTSSHSIPPLTPTVPEGRENLRGLRLRTVMVTNIPHQLRSQHALKEYFEYYMSRPSAIPNLAPLRTTTQPGLLQKIFFTGFRQARHLMEKSDDIELDDDAKLYSGELPTIDRVSIVRKMTELASLLERREEVLRKLEFAHIRLAKKVLLAVKSIVLRRHRAATAEQSVPRTEDTLQSTHADNESQQETREDLLVRSLGSYVKQFGLLDQKSVGQIMGNVFHRHTHLNDGDHLPGNRQAFKQLPVGDETEETVWDVLLRQPRTVLDSYQPLIRLSRLFRGSTVPSIDYHTAKLQLLTALINENRGKPTEDYHPSSTAFVTFAHPLDARRAIVHVPAHPNNPLACIVSPAPDFEDLDWARLMKSTFRGEFLKDWVVTIGVWAFTFAWIFPLTPLVALVSIQNIARFFPVLGRYLVNHQYQQELISSFLPTLLVSLLAMTIPLLLLLIGKKAHTILTLSGLHDRIMIRYYKFLVVNVLVFFCIGVAAAEAFLNTFKSPLTVLPVIANAFPSAGPFYVGWLTFSMGIHGALEIGLFGLPLIVYPSTKRATTLRRRAVGIRPRTFNYYYWLPNHTLVMIICMVFAVLNPLVIPFALFYFTVESVVVKNQLLHVYAKKYELNGRLNLIRFIRYSLDGAVLSQVVFLAYMAILKEKPLIVLSAVLIAGTLAAKVWLTTVTRRNLEQLDRIEANLQCGVVELDKSGDLESGQTPHSREHSTTLSEKPGFLSQFKIEKLKGWRVPTFRPRSLIVPVVRTRPIGDHKDNFSRLRTSTEAADVKSDDDDTTNLLPKSTSRSTKTQHLPRQGTRFVTAHNEHPPWDDRPLFDRPYDNPYYTVPVEDFLWLPRNPFGLLNLDDSFDLHKSITTEPGAGDLGRWLGSGSDSEFFTSFVSATPTARSGMHRQLSGSESIGMSSRVGLQNIVDGPDDEVEVADDQRSSTFRNRRRRPSLGTQRSSTNSIRRSNFSIRRQQTVDGDYLKDPQDRSSTFSSDGARLRSDSSGIDPAAKPDIHAQGELLRSPGAISMSNSASSRNLTVTTREAIVSEVIAEEQLATEDRIQEEEEGAAQTDKQHSPWLTGWLYSRSPQHTSTDS